MAAVSRMSQSTIITSRSRGEEDGSPPMPPQLDDPVVEIPVPPTVPETGISIQAHKLWVGNLDKRLTQQNILRFSSPYGKIVSFKYMLHSTGAEKGEPRDYCFIEYSTREEAEKAKEAMNGKVALGKSIVVDWARPDQYLKKTGSTVSETWDASSVSATLRGGASTAAKIAALEAKLLQMDKDQVTTSSSCSGGRQRKPRRLPTSYYSPEHVRRKHGSNIKIQRPQKQGSKGDNSLKRL